MADPNDVLNPAEPGTDPSTEPKPTGEPAKAPAEDQKVPLHRLNEEIAKAKKAEADLEAARKDADMTKQQFASLQQQVAALTGKPDLSRTDYSDALEQLGERFNVDKGFLKELAKVQSEISKKQIEPSLALASQEAGFDRELDSLMEKIPAAEDMTRTEIRQLKKLAYSKEYINAPLEAAYIVWKANNPAKTDDKKTLEASRPSGTVPSSDPDISKMSIDEFKKYSNSLGSKRRRG